LILANPDLKHGLKEAETIKKIYNMDAVVISTKDATFETIKKNAEGCGKLIFITDARSDPGAPLNTKILLKENLYVADILKVGKRCFDLVDLDVCGNTVGESIRENELMGFVWAFFNAGAASVLATLWPIDDKSTKILKENFYFNLKKGESKDKALWNAQLKLIENEKFNYPYYWAPFVLFGDYL